MKSPFFFQRFGREKQRYNTIENKGYDTIKESVKQARPGAGGRMKTVVSRAEAMGNEKPWLQLASSIPETDFL